MLGQHGRKIGLAVPIFLLGVLITTGVPSSGRPRPDKWAQPVPSKALPNLFKVDDTVYRSGQPAPDGYEEARAMGIKSVVNLRHDLYEDLQVKSAGLVSIEVRIVVENFTEADVVKALKAIQRAPKPVLVHCKAGTFRTGVIMAMYRIVFQGWTKKEAEAELVKGGFGFDKWRHPNILAFIRKADVAGIKSQLGL
jgi:tyrosine-protein phosphatase SIW14